MQGLAFSYLGPWHKLVVGRAQAWGGTLEGSRHLVRRLLPADFLILGRNRTRNPNAKVDSSRAATRPSDLLSRDSVSAIFDASFNDLIVEPSGTPTCRRDGWLPSGLFGLVADSEDFETSQIALETAILPSLHAHVDFPIRVLRTLAGDCIVGGSMTDTGLWLWDICAHASHVRHGLIR